ncbi:MAG: insulinase family protein [Myxococcales bacterium]|nr:insulinase family protein [Myxococcales bacterium]
MQTVLVTDPAFPCAHLTLHFAAGPAFDPPERQGLTALTHRALIRGTRKRSREALEEAVEILGAELVTATRNHAVSLGGPVLTRHLDAYIDLVGETLCEPLLAEDEIEKVKRELLAEFEAACDEDGALARIWFQRVMYPGHPFGQGASGSKATLAAITPADVAAHAARVYTRDNLIVGASGDVTADRLAARLDHALAPLPDGAPLDWSFPPVPQTKGRRVTLVDRPGRSQAQILVGHPSIAAADPDFIALHIALTALGGTFSSRLMQVIRVERGWSYGAYARVAAERAGGTFMMTAAPSTENAVDTLGLLFSEYSRFVDGSLDDDEIEFARDHLARAFPFTIETAGLQVTQRVRALLLGRPADHVDRWLDLLAAPTPDQIRDAVRRRLTPDDLTAVMVGSWDAPLRAGVEALPGVVAVDVVPAGVLP